MNEVASANFLSKSLVEVPNKAPKSTSSRPKPEKEGNFLALKMLYNSFLCSVDRLNNGVTKTESTSVGNLAKDALTSVFTGTTTKS